MRHLILMRHAESGMLPLGSGNTSDKERPLTQRGQQDASMQGQNLIQHNIIPDLVLCSNATRTQSTWDMVHASIKDALTIDFQNELRDDLYHAGPRFLHDLISKASDNVDVLMIVAHNPGIHELSMQLATPLQGQTPSEAALSLQGGFPPATMAIFEIDAQGWFDISHTNAKLTHVIKA